MTSPLVLVNPSNRSRTSNRYLFAFGAYGDTLLLVWKNSFEDALDEAIDWIADNEPGLLADDAVAEEYNRAIAEGLSEDEAQERATEDTTCGGNEGHYVNSWEWTVDEDPSREDVKRIVAACGVKLAALHSGYLRERKTPCKRAASLSRTVT